MGKPLKMAISQLSIVSLYRDISQGTESQC